MYLVGEIFASEVLGRDVYDREGEVIGKLEDLLVRIKDVFPTVSALVVNIKSGKKAIIPFENIELFNRSTITANIYKNEVTETEPGENDISIAKDILDKQIVDIDGAKVVRVNDVKLGEMRGNLCIIAADIGFNAILRRIGVANIAKGLMKKVGGGKAQNLISWNYLQPVDPKVSSLTLKVTKSKLSELHPSDIASIMSQIPPKERSALFDTLELETAAEALHELEPEAQVSIIHGMDKEQASDILELMPPDEAADLLGDLPEETAQELLNLMEDEEAEDVQELLEHEDDTAGGLMTTDFLSFPPTMTVKEAFKNLRLMAPDVEMIYYIYVTDDNDKLLGVVSIKDLLLAADNTQLSAIMKEQVKSVLPDTDEEEVAEMISKYNFYAIPVVNEENVILGIITVDDIVDLVIPPPSRKKKLRV
ncbi:MAG: CBS domain-containing protein [Candidatus Schekmanbacteria bacterium]|nr:MAG: CBS domain-containing protein [Candidatus Schekmanbacteria bacterium]